MPLSISGVRRARSTTRRPAIASYTRARRASVASSVEPCRRKRMLAHASLAIWRFDKCPALYDARAKWRADEPSIRVLSRSKNAAARFASAAIHFDDDGVALAATGADRRDTAAAASAPELVDE